MKIIKHQKQGYDDCVCTCIAMITGLKRRYVVSRYHNRYMNERGFNIDNILDDLCIEYRRCYQDEPITDGKIYLVTVPSLNMLGLFHEIIVDTRDGFHIFDPNKGVIGRKYYVMKVSPSAKSQIKLRSYLLDYEVYT